MFAHGIIDPCSTIKPSDMLIQASIMFLCDSVWPAGPVITIHLSGDWINHNTAHPGCSTEIYRCDKQSKTLLCFDYRSLIIILADQKMFADVMIREFVVVCLMKINNYTQISNVSHECCVSWLSIVLSLLWELKTGECSQSDINMSAFRSWYNREITGQPALIIRELD